MSTINEMTMRQYHEAVVAGNITAEVIAKAQNEIAKLDAANAKRAATQSKKSKENEPIKQAIYDLLSEKGTMTSPDIAVALTTEENEVSTSKASSMCRQMVEDGRLTVEEIKVPKKGKMKQYTAVVADAE